MILVGANKWLPISLGAAAAFAAGAAVTRSSSIAVVLIASSLSLIIGEQFASQLLLFLIAIQGIVQPSSILGVNPAFVACWLAALFLTIADHRQVSHDVRRQNAPFSKAMLIAVVLYPLLLVIAAVNSDDPSSLSAALSYINYLSLLALAGRLAMRGLTLLTRPVLGALAFHSAMGIIEVVRGNASFYSQWKYSEATTVGGITRAASTTADPNYLALTILVLLAVLVISKGPRAWSRLELLVSLASGVALLLTFSRAGFIGMAAALFAYLLQRRGGNSQERSRKLLLSAGAAVGGALLFLLPQFVGIRDRLTSIGPADPSIASRLRIQELALHIASGNLWDGIGPGAFAHHAQEILSVNRPFDAQTDVLNTYLLALLNGGLPLLIVLLLMLGLSLWWAWRIQRLGACLLLGSMLTLASLDALTFAPLFILMGALAVRPPESPPSESLENRAEDEVIAL